LESKDSTQGMESGDVVWVKQKSLSPRRVLCWVETETEERWWSCLLELKQKH